MSKKEKDIESKSLTQLAWHRLKKNKLSLLGLFIIFTALFIAVLGPVIRPDSTPYANDQVLEITTHKPGFKIDFLHIKKNQKQKDISLFERLTSGVKNDFTVVPIYDYSFEGFNIIIEKYTGGRSEENNGPIDKYNIAEIVYAVDSNGVKEANGYLDFNSLDEGELHLSIEELIATVKENNIVTKKYYLGTDKYGRDMLSRLMAGTWISLFVGFISVFISIIIGISLGALAGYYRGWLDDIIMWFINVVWSIPTLLLVIAITMALGKGIWQIFIAVGLTMWVEVARVVRGQMLSLREKEFVEAGRALGFTNARIIFKHIIPNILGPVIVISAINFAAAILIEAGLSFLGFGAQPPQATWGKIIAEHKGFLITGKAYLAVLPGIAIILMVLAFVMVGNGIRDSLDSKSVDDMPTV